MGKNQAYKAMQRSKLGSTSAGPEEIEDGMMDGSFHSPEWHAARLASLKTSHTVTWEEFKQKQKEDELKKGELEADKDKMMREYRALLDAERASKLSHGRNHSGIKSHHKKERKDKDLKTKSSKKRKILWNDMLVGPFDRESSRSLFSVLTSFSTKGGHPNRVPLVHPQNLPAVRMRGTREGQGQGLRGGKKEGTGPEPSTLAAMVKRVVVQCLFLNSLAV